MFRVIETFSGIGSQAKALKNIGIEHEIVATSDWDINAIISYDLIHNGPQDIQKYKEYSSEELTEQLVKYTLSMDGKKAMSIATVRKLPLDLKMSLLCAIERCNNLVSITDIKGEDIPPNIDLFTYSFPCQDLSICGFWHGNLSGIDRNANNRSGMLWEVERILAEMSEQNIELPKFLLMENVSNILSNTHKRNFDEWKEFLVKLGYHNQVYKLNAKNFGIPQKRERVFMLSIMVDENLIKKMQVINYFSENNLEDPSVAKRFRRRNLTLSDILRLDYSNDYYKEEADYSQPNATPSRSRIYELNDHLFDGKNISNIIVNTITTKQDRHPNSGVVDYNSGREGKALYRNLTPRECFMLMGFDEDDFQILVENNLNINKKNKLFTREKLIKMAGNSIVVDVLEAIFKQIIELDDMLNKTINPYNLKQS